jgi:hypothetical protein
VETRRANRRSRPQILSWLQKYLRLLCPLVW